MIEIKLSDLDLPKYSNKAIIRNDFPGFKEDYLAIHCLIIKYSPNTILEIGTSSGNGTNVICNAMGVKKLVECK